MDQRKCFTDVKKHRQRRLGNYFEVIKKRGTPNVFVQVHRWKKDEDLPAVRQWRGYQTEIADLAAVEQEQGLNQTENQINNHYKRFSNQWWKVNGSVLLGGGIILIILALILVFLFFSSTNCTQLYKQSRCWESSRSQEPNCLQLSKCIGKEGIRNYTQQLLTALTAIVILIKKYWRQILDLTRRLKR